MKDTRIPQSITECTQPDSISTRLLEWAEWLEKWGKWLFIIFIVYGFISTAIDFIEMVEIDIAIALGVYVSSLVTWALYAFLEYCAYNALAILIRALASITQNVSTSTKIALFRAASETGVIDTNTPIPEEPHSPDPVQKSLGAYDAPGAEPPASGQTPKDHKVPERTAVTEPDKTAALNEHLNYALRFTTDDGMKRYLHSIHNDLSMDEQNELTRILAVPQVKLRAAANEYVNRRKEG